MELILTVLPIFVNSTSPLNFTVNENLGKSETYMMLVNSEHNFHNKHYYHYTVQIKYLKIINNTENKLQNFLPWVQLGFVTYHDVTEIRRITKILDF